jgi:uncharacterized protein (UPF0335 family)
MTTGLQDGAQQQLRHHIERIERLEEEKKATAGEIADEFAAAKASGFDVTIMREVLKIRRMSKAERSEKDAVLDTYLHALGMLDGTPLGEWAKREDGGREDGGREPTISINGGPAHPMSVVREAAGIVKRAKRGEARGAA